MSNLHLNFGKQFNYFKRLCDSSSKRSFISNFQTHVWHSCKWCNLILRTGYFRKKFYDALSARSNTCNIVYCRVEQNM